MAAREIPILEERRTASQPRPGHFTLVLLAIALASAIPRLWLGASQFIEYDGYWHVFIAQQDTWSRFWEDIYANAHPPLFFLLLKAVLPLGRSLLVYRSVSILSGILSVYLIGAIARKVTGSEWRAWQTALAFGFALPAVIISCEVRSYSLSTMFILASFASLLRIVDAPDVKADTKARAGFAIWTILACLSEYFAFFYAGAAMLALAARCLRNSGTDGTFSGFRVSPKWWKELATMTPIAATIAILYGGHAGHLATIQGHLLPYYFDPKGKESIVRFVLRNSRNLLNLFLPVRIGSSIIVLAIGIMAMILGAWVAVRSLSRARFTIGVTAITLLAVMASGIAGKYPYGGDLRQQFLLFPLLVLCLAIVIERAAGGMGRYANMALAVAACAVGVIQFAIFPKTSTNVLQPQMAAFEKMEPRPTAVYLDQYNLITFFIYHHDWKWTAESRQPINGDDIYDLSRNGEHLVVFRDKTRWNMDADDPQVLDVLAKSLRTGRAPEVSVFSVRQSPPRAPISNVRALKFAISRAASERGICAERMSVNATQWFVTFRDSRCPTLEETLRTTGDFDDADDSIEYVGAWTQVGVSGARQGTVSYSRDAGSVARLEFDGTQITYGYTRAFNRGIAEIRIDGVNKGTIDLYDKQIAWQAARTWDGLPAGRHAFELLVTGRRNAQAKDQFVDLDWLSVK